jgi:hypothetical protein
MDQLFFGAEFKLISAERAVENTIKHNEIRTA